MESIGLVLFECSSPAPPDLAHAAKALRFRPLYHFGQVWSQFPAETADLRRFVPVRGQTRSAHIAFFCTDIRHQSWAASFRTLPQETTSSSSKAFRPPSSARFVSTLGVPSETTPPTWPRQSMSCSKRRGGSVWPRPAQTRRPPLTASTHMAPTEGEPFQMSSATLRSDGVTEGWSNQSLRHRLHIDRRVHRPSPRALPRIASIPTETAACNLAIGS